MNMSRLLPMLAICCSPAVLMAAADWYVATNGAGSPGTNWSTAFKTLQDGLDAAGDGDTVYLAGQTFARTTELAWGSGAGNTTLMGGYSATNDLPLPGTRDGILWPTVLLMTTTNQRVISICAVTNGKLDGVTITGARRYPNVGNWYGGGVFASNCVNLTMASCVVTGNLIQAKGWIETYYGAGIHAENTSLTLTNCIVSYNRNMASYYVWANGAGVSAKGSGQLNLYGCVLAGNWVDLAAYAGIAGEGAAVYATCPARIRNCLIWGNVGGKLTCSAVYLSGGGELANCTVADNVATRGVHGAGGTVGVTNSILWNNGDDVYGTMTLAFSNIEDGDNYGVKGCIKTDPLFEYGYYRMTNSPCADAGTNTPAFYGLSGRMTRADGMSDTGRMDMGYHYATGIFVAGFCPDLYVSPSGNNINTGTNWAQAFRTIGKALSRVQDGTKVHIASGLYTNGLETFPLRLKGTTGVQLLGTNRETTVINAAGATEVSALELTFLSRTLIEGCTITGVRRSPTGGDDSYGGGISAVNCGNLSIGSCMITGNWIQATGWYQHHYGGGMGALNTALVVVDSVISKNRNAAGYLVYAHGGGIGLRGSGRLVMERCIIADNWLSVSSLPGQGAAVYVEGEAIMRGCEASRNTASMGGTNAVHLSAAGLVENCTVVSNAAVCGIKGGNGVSIVNSIAWGNSDDLDDASMMSLAYCDIEDGDNDGISGCFSADPLFMDTAQHNYRILGTSPCRNSGIFQPWMEQGLDLDGNPRIHAFQVDIGAYESQWDRGTFILIE